MTRYLTEEEVKYINHSMIEELSPMEPRGVKDSKLLKSALERPRQSLFGKDAYPTIYLKSAALFESLTQNHPFYNGNKRTGFAAVATFLSLNGHDLTASEQAAEDFTVYVVAKKPPIREIANWIEKYSVSR